MKRFNRKDNLINADEKFQSFKTTNRDLEELHTQLRELKNELKNKRADISAFVQNNKEEFMRLIKEFHKIRDNEPKDLYKHLLEQLKNHHDVDEAQTNYLRMTREAFGHVDKTGLLGLYEGKELEYIKINEVLERLKAGGKRSRCRRRCSRDRKKSNRKSGSRKKSKKRSFRRRTK